MKNRIVALLAGLTAGLGGTAQNLVPNGSFEQYSGCPNTFSLIDSTLFWFCPQNPGSSDYFNSCGTPSVNVPYNAYGWQNARTGAAYAGIFLYNNGGQYREYIEVQLTAPLTANSCYHFNMFIDLADICQFTTDAIGVYFSAAPIMNVPNNDPLPYIPQLSNTPGNYPDTSGWMSVGGDYFAQGGENYITIGNFKDDLNTSSILVNPNSIYPYGFCFVDDVSLIDCSVGVDGPDPEKGIIVFPTVFTDHIFVNGTTGDEEYTLMDLSGSLTWSGKNIARHDLAFISAGTYLLKVSTGSFSRTIKVVKQ
jgi:OOP family OmpA-OmpF porin